MNGDAVRYWRGRYERSEDLDKEKEEVKVLLNNHKGGTSVDRAMRAAARERLALIQEEVDRRSA